MSSNTSLAGVLASSLVPNFDTTTNNNESAAADDALDYHYDLEESLYNYNLGELIPVTLVYGLALLAGIIGNTLVVFSIARYQRMRSITNIFLVSLASADLLVVIICVPIKGAAFFSFAWRFGEFLCKFIHYMQNLSMICSVMTLTMMSIERYIAILYPLRAKYLCTHKHAKVVIIIIWVLSFILAVPVLIGQTHKAVGERIKAHWCIKIWDLPVFSILYEVYMSVILFIVPVFVMIVAYVGICRELGKVASVRASMRADKQNHLENPASNNGMHSSRIVAPMHHREWKKVENRKTSNEDDKIRKQVIKMLIVVVLLFSICWAPILINNVLVAVGVLDQLHHGYLKPMRAAFFVMSYLNSCVNPIVYGFMSKNFRESFKLALLSCCGRSTHAHNFGYSQCGHTSFATRTTGMHGSKTILDRAEVDPEQVIHRAEMLRPMMDDSDRESPM